MIVKGTIDKNIHIYKFDIQKKRIEEEIKGFM